MSQRQQLVRIMEIDAQIRAGRYPNAARIAEKLEVSRRVIFKDVEFMRDQLGAPIEHDREHGGWYYTSAAFTLRPTFVSRSELMAFFLSVEVARCYLGTPLEKTLLEGVGKFAQNFRGEVEIDFMRLREYYTFAAPATPGVHPGLLADLQKAIADRHPLHMRYFTASRNEWNERTIHPHHIYHSNGEWYVFAFDDFRQQMRNFHLGRIDEWQVQNSRFERQPDFNGEAWMQSAFQAERGQTEELVTVRFDAMQAPYIRERARPQWLVEEQADGGLLVRFTASGLGEVKRWVLQYGPHAEALEPPTLRQMVGDEVRATAQLYGADDK